MYRFGRQFSRNLVWSSLVIVSLVLLVRLNHLPIFWSLCHPNLILPTLLTNTLPPTRPDQNTHQLWIKLQFGFPCWKCNWFQSTSKSGINLCIHNTWSSTGSSNKTKIQGTFSDAVGEISSKLYGDWLWDENFKFCLIFTHFSRFSPFSGYIWWNNTLSSLENFSLNSILVFVFLMSHHDNGGFLKIAQKRDSISKKTSFCIMVINTDHQESWFLSVGHPLCALR